MSDILDYVDWRGDIPLKCSPVNFVDAMILSQIVLQDLSGCVGARGSSIMRCAKKYFAVRPKDNKLGKIIPREINDLFKKIADSARFRALIVKNYVSDIDVETEIQFSAMTVDAREINTRLVVFSGTDDTIVGWRENFNLIYKTPTGAQTESVKYLDAAAEGFKGDVIVLGHSKGGHLSVYSTVNCSDKTYAKISRAINLDGPGIPDGQLEAEKFGRRKRKIVTILPQGSLIGRLFEHGEDFIIAHSVKCGLFQHDVFSWEVLGTEIKEDEDFTENGYGVDEGLRGVLSEMNAEERERFVDGFFGILTSTSCTTLTELFDSGPEVLKAFLKADGDNKKAVNHTLLRILSNKHVRKFFMDTGKGLREKQAAERAREEND